MACRAMRSTRRVISAAARREKVISNIRQEGAERAPLFKSFGFVRQAIP
jgi:hypothetical protein